MAVDLVHAARVNFEAGNIDAAWNQINIALDDQWERPDALYIAGLIQRYQGNVAIAAHLFRRALATEKQHVNIWMHYGACLHDMHLYDDARKAFELVRAQLPNDPQPIANIASGYIQQGKLRDAINTANEALFIEPTNKIARIAKGYGCLGLGRWKDAWEYVEDLYGEHVATRIYNAKENEEPEWDGSKGKTVVVTCDQGIGDIIMLSQCLNDMVKDCKLVIVECARRMEWFFKRNFPQCHVYATQHIQYGLDWVKDYQIDARINLSYLGRFYRTKDSDFPRRAYIKPDETRVQQWKDWLSQFPRPWTGLAWEGGLVSTMKKMRSVPLEALAPVIDQGGTFIDMTYRDCREEVARWNINHEQQIIHPYIDATNYDDTIALAAALDDVVTVTTALAHVCGALGRGASVIVPEVAQWRYQYRMDDGGMIWYPRASVQLFRQQPGQRDFGPAIQRLANVRKELKFAA